jgi:hypothetical protein
LCVGTTIFALQACARLQPAPVVECTTSYGGQSQSYIVEPTRDPYRVKPINIADRFDFKAVLLMEAKRTALLNLYTYGQGDQGSVLLHEVKYVLRFPSTPSSSMTRFGFTGEQLIYDHNARELRYWCGFKWPR